MKFSTAEIFQALHNEGCHPTRTNFASFCAKVEDYLLNNSGFPRENTSTRSLKHAKEAAEILTKGARNLWDKYPSFNRFLKQFKLAEIEVNLLPSRPPQPPKPTATASTSVSTNVGKKTIC